MPLKNSLTDLTIRFTGFDSVHAADYVFNPPHAIDCYVLLLTNTPAKFFHNGVLEAFPAGYAVLYAPMQRIYYQAHNGPFSDNWLYFTTSSPAFASFPGLGRPMRMSDPEYLRRLFQLITWESSTKNHNDEILEHLLRVMYLRLMDDYAAQGQTPMQYALTRLHREIVNSPEYPWTVAHMARQLSVSPGYLQAMYKKEFGVSCIDDVIDARLRKAQEILSYTDDSIADVAAACGYRNVEHFIRQFRKAFGVTPAAFRKARRAAPLTDAPRSGPGSAPGLTTEPTALAGGLSRTPTMWLRPDDAAAPASEEGFHTPMDPSTDNSSP